MHRFVSRAPRLAIIVSAALSFVSCGRGPDGGAPTDAQPLAAAELAAIRYVRENTSAGIPYRLNLADEQQHAYVVETLRRFGRSRDEAPRLYQLLDEARAGEAGEPVPVREATADSAVLGGINYITEFGAHPSGVFHTNAFSTYPSDQVPYNTQVLVSLIDVDSARIINSGQANVFAQTNVQVPVEGTPPAGHTDVVANALFLIAPRQGDPLRVYHVSLEDARAVAEPCQLSPGYSTGEVMQCETSSGTTCVNAGAMPRPIKVCYGPRIQSDCDYGCEGSGHPTNLIFPIRGSVDLEQSPPTPLTGSLYIVLQDVTGGGCVLEATENTTGSLTDLIAMDGTVASWDLAPASFPNQDCLRPSGMLFNYTFQLYVQTVSGYAGVTFTSDTSQARLPDTVIVPQIDVIEGCLPDGVLVRMADGSTKAVETFAGYGDELVRAGGGGTRAVTATTWGTETRPLVHLRDDRGHDLLVTEAHPVITTGGPVMAMDLEVGDVVLTESGEATLVEVGRQESPVPVPVHNLRVGTAEEAAEGRNTFYANGILVGDQLTQRYVHMQAVRQRRLTQEQILEVLPPEWHQDYLNAVN